MIACVSIPYFATAVERRDDATLANKPLITGGQPWEPQPVFGFSSDVAKMGVKPGISLRQAHLYAPLSHFMPAHPTRYQEVAAEFAAVLGDFSTRAELDQLWHPPLKPVPHLPIGARALPAQVYLDLDGLSSKEALPFSQEIGRKTRTDTRLTPSIGLAQHRFTAHVAASVARIGRLLPASVDDEAEFLAPRSINYLPLDIETHRRLHLLGIHTLGDLAALPLPALQEQFGPGIEPCYRLARAEGTFPIRPQPPARVEEITFQFEDPIVNRQMLAQLLAHMAVDLEARLQAAALTGREIRLRWATDGGTKDQATIILRQPTATAARITTVLHEILSQICFDEGVIELCVAIGDLVQAVGGQLSLFPTLIGEPLTGRIQQTLQNVTAKHGPGCIYQVALTDSDNPLPERRFQLQPCDTTMG